MCVVVMPSPTEGEVPNNPSRSNLVGDNPGHSFYADGYRELCRYVQIPIGIRLLANQLALKGNENILDLGCGEGSFSALLATRVPGGRCLGIDVNKEMIALAAKTSEFPNNAIFLVGDMRALPIIHRPYFDYVVSNFAFHWLRGNAERSWQKETEECLKGVVGTLKPSGQLLITFPAEPDYLDLDPAIYSVAHNETWSQFFRNSDGALYRAPSAPSKAEYPQILSTAGFAVLSDQTTLETVTFPNYEVLAKWVSTMHRSVMTRIPNERHAKFATAVADKYKALQSEPSSILPIIRGDGVDMRIGVRTIVAKLASTS